MRLPIHVDRKQCNRDGACVSQCPTRVIRMDPESGYPEALPEFDDFCIECGHCVVFCPKAAFSLDWLTPEKCGPIKDELAVTPKQAEQLLCGRRSIRSFKKKRVPRSTLRKVLEVASSAPSARNQQPWHWIVVWDPEEVKRFAATAIEWMRQTIRELPDGQHRRWLTRAVASHDSGYDRLCRGAPHVVILHADENLAFVSQDCTLALGFLDLYAASIGLGTCWATMFYEAINAHPPLAEAIGLPPRSSRLWSFRSGLSQIQAPRHSIAQSSQGELEVLDGNSPFRYHA
jgi:nitroreductase/NAD-dependent dihydropyrimidine dehydrogenase PreA subunit